MKKSILSFVFVLALATVSSAAPRFGVIGEQNAGIGAFITDDMYNAQLTFGSNNSESKVGGTTTKSDNSAIKVGANYKIALDSVTALTAGVSYSTLSGDFSEGSFAGEIDSESTIAVVAGFERALSSNIVLTVDMDLYSVQTLEIKDGPEITNTTLFQNASVGVAYLF